MPRVETLYCDTDCGQVGREWLLGDGRTALRSVILCPEHRDSVSVGEAYKMSAPATTMPRRDGRAARDAPQPRRTSILNDLPVITD